LKTSGICRAVAPDFTFKSVVDVNAGKGNAPKCRRNRASERAQMITTNLLLWIHMFALVDGGSNKVVMPVVDATLPGLTIKLEGTLFGD
jgi:hypothetical protein